MMEKNKLSIRNNVAYQWIVGDENNINRFPFLNHAIVCYVGISIMISALFLISPFVTFISPTPLRHLKSYLGIVGAMLICADILTNRGAWRGAYVSLLYGICAVALISSVLMSSYGITDNLFVICWSLIQFALFYSCAIRIEQNALKKNIRVFYSIIALIWFVACCISLYQYAAQIGYNYVIDPLSDDTSLARQGFIDNRLFGIFNPLNHAAFLSLLLFCVGFYYTNNTDIIVAKIVLIIANVAFICHIILSGSRSVQLCLMCVVMVWAFLRLRKKNKYTTGLKQIVIPLFGALLAVIIVFGCFTGTKMLLSNVPQWLGNTVGMEDAENDPTLADDNESSTNEKKNLLERKGLEEDPSNDRLAIWKDYIGLYEDIGVLGLSPGNYMSYICQNHPELFIVKAIQAEFPGKFVNNIIYHVHSGYMMIFVSTGFLGLMLMLTYLILYMRRVLTYLIRNKSVNETLILSFSIVLIGLISVAFDKGVFFMDNPLTFIFWLAAGILIKETETVSE